VTRLAKNSNQARPVEELRWAESVIEGLEPITSPDLEGTTG
jgi:hypothetical protein